LAAQPAARAFSSSFMLRSLVFLCSSAKYAFLKVKGQNVAC